MQPTTQSTSSNPNAGRGLGIAGLILGILAAIISFIPCLGMYAMGPGILGLILSIISIIQANKGGVTKGMAIAGLICSILGTSLAIWQYRQITSGVEALQKELEKYDTIKSSEEANDSIQYPADSLEQQ